LSVWRVPWFLCEDLVAKPDTLIADVYAVRSCDEAVDLILVLPGERAKLLSA
jgi:hypothetical protein